MANLRHWNKPLPFLKLWETRVRGEGYARVTLKTGLVSAMPNSKLEILKEAKTSMKVSKRLNVFPSSLICWHLSLPLPTFLSLLNHVWLQPQLKNVTLVSGYPKRSKWMQAQSLQFISKSVINHYAPPRIIVIFISLDIPFYPFIVPLPPTVFPLFPVTDLATFGDIPSSEWVLHSNFRSYILEIRDFYIWQYRLPGRLVNSYCVDEETRFILLKHYFMQSKILFWSVEVKINVESTELNF